MVRQSWEGTGQRIITNFVSTKAKQKSNTEELLWLYPTLFQKYFTHMKWGWCERAW